MRLFLFLITTLFAIFISKVQSQWVHYCETRVYNCCPRNGPDFDFPSGAWPPNGNKKRIYAGSTETWECGEEVNKSWKTRNGVKGEYLGKTAEVDEEKRLINSMWRTNNQNKEPAWGKALRRCCVRNQRIGCSNKRNQNKWLLNYVESISERTVLIREPGRAKPYDLKCSAPLARQFRWFEGQLAKALPFWDQNDWKRFWSEGGQSGGGG